MAGVIYHNYCGWSGQASELVLDYYQGILCGVLCPVCGEECPFFLDDWTKEEPEDDDPEWTPRNRDRTR